MNKIDRTSPRTFWKYSNEYLEAALVVLPRPESAVDKLRQKVSIPAYFLTGHAIELALKSFLRARGMAVSELRYKPYGHDLVALMAEAKRRKLGGVVKVSRTERKAIELLNSTYKEKELEYLAVGIKELPAYEALITLASKLVASLKNFVISGEPNKRFEPTRSKQRAAQA